MGPAPAFETCTWSCATAFENFWHTSFNFSIINFLLVCVSYFSSFQVGFNPDP